MRTTLLCAAVMSLLLASAPALAAPLQTDTATMTWQDGAHQLGLESRDGIVRVTQTDPAYFGVRSGDRLLRMDGQPVRSLDDVTSFLARNSRSRVPVILLRKGSQMTVTIDAVAWSKVLPPAPPAPPAPPLPPPRA